jgi:hypothetical protein
VSAPGFYANFANFCEVNPKAAEQRHRVAHGETVGINGQTEKVPDGAKEIPGGDFLSPHPGLEFIWTTHPRLHRGLLSYTTPWFQQVAAKRPDDSIGCHRVR